MTRLVYSDQKRDFTKGVTYQNPRFFDGNIPKHITSVIVIGDWPRVVETCKESNLPCKILKPGEKLPVDDDLPPASEPAKSSGGTEPDDDDGDKDKDPVVIPDDLSELSFRELKALVKQIDPEQDVSSKKEAIEFLQNQ